jgi:hypothetical protein
VLRGLTALFLSAAREKVRAMTRSATPENEQMLLQVALHGTGGTVRSS